jgi:hypothetical protein
MQGWWNFEGWPTAGEWSAWWAFLTLVVATIAAVVALAQFSNYIREREESERPFIVVDYHFRSVLMDVEVRNTSNSVATNIELRVDVPFQSTLPGRADVLNRVFSDRYEIKQLAPGNSIRWTLDRTPDYFQAKLPRNYEVTVSYTDPRAQRRDASWKFWLPKLRVRYDDHYDLNLEQWGEANADSDYANKNWNIATRNELVFRNIETKLGKIADSLDDFSSRPIRKMPITKRGNRS